jgi:LPS export ABC transporter protein LptC
VLTREILTKQLLAALIGGVFLLLIFYTTSFMRQHKASVPWDFPKSRADVRIDHFSLVQSRGDEHDWELEAREAKVFEKDSKALLEDIRVKFYGNQGVSIHFDADKGVLNTSTKDLFVERVGEPLSITLSNGYTVHAPSLRWVNARREILSDGPVTIVGPRVEIKGKHLVVGADWKDFQVIGDVQVTLR